MSSQTTSGRNLNYHGYNQHLTPRTPRSRSGKPVTSFGEDETGPRSSSGDGEALDEVDLLYTQSDPLLRSSASVAFPPEQVTRTPLIRSPRYPKHHDQASSRSRFQHLLQIIPLILGAVGALGLLVLILLSVHRPQILQYYILNNSTYTSAFSPSQKQLESGLDYSNHTSFPLESIEYEEECWSFQNSHETSRGDYWEMKDAEMMDVPHEHAPGEGGICSSTITYILDGSVGLFYDLALIAQAAAFARERNRTFIIDDTKWNRGRWTDHFLDVRETQPGPEPNCHPPPPRELVACPRTARHWVITPRTAKFHFGHEFSDKYEDPYKSDTARIQPIYERAFTSFQSTILPSLSIRRELTQLRQQHAQTPYLGIHIRHGDRYPDNREWRGDYVPISQYISATSSMWEKALASSTPEVSTDKPTVYVASDSYAAFQDHLALSLSPDNVWGLHIAGETKWKYMASPQGYVQRVFEGRKTRSEERKRWTQGVVLDFAMISGAWLEEGEKGPVGTICTATSNICRMAAVALGWERAFERSLWVDLDWHGLVVPSWSAFEFH